MPLPTFRREVTAVLPGTPDVHYEILSDYDGYAEWMPHLVSSRLLAEEGDLAIAEFRLASPKGAVRTVECIQERNRQVITRSLGAARPSVQMHWTLAPADDGKTKVTLQIRASADWRLLTPTGRHAVSAPQHLDALRRRVHVTRPDVATSDTPGETILELFETPEGYVVSFRNKQWRLVEMTGGRHD